MNETHPQSAQSETLEPLETPMPEMFTSRVQYVIAYSGLLFMFVSIVSFAGIVWWLTRIGASISSEEALVPSQLMAKFTIAYMPTIIMFLSGIITAIVGSALLNTAGAAGRDVISKQDYPLLSGLIRAEKEKGIDLYIRLNGLTGLPGFFTKVGISGLPLATIGLTAFFTLFGLLPNANSKLFDLANLTLGAFLGSYVQRQISTSRSVGTEQLSTNNPDNNQNA
jgi:hypothetical protein